MQNHFKQLSLPSTTLTSENQSEQATDLAKLSIRLPLRRFTRSNSSISRSKSKEQSREENPSNFFIKNICNKVSANPKYYALSPHSTLLDLHNPQNEKRERTPTKKQCQALKTQKKKYQFENEQIELQWIRLQEKYQQSEFQREKLLIINKQIQQKLTSAEIKLAEVLTLFNQSLNKLRAYELKTQPKEKINNLAKLKREIAKQKQIDGNSSQVLEKQLQIANSTIIVLRQSLKTSEQLREEIEQSSKKLVSQREAFLQSLVQQIRDELHTKENTLQKMKIQLNILHIRQLKKAEIDQTNEQILSLKRRNTSILKKYHETKQQLFAYKRKQWRENRFFSEIYLDTRGSSLSLSP